jgi:hypothetical protein
MAQMPIQSMSGRAESFTAVTPAAFPAQPTVAIPRASYVFDPAGISGGKLRPGSIDQELFKAHLAAAQKAEMVASPAPARMAAPSGIPTLSPAQLAALGVDMSGAPGQSGELVIDIPAENPVDPGQAGGGPSGHPAASRAGGIIGGMPDGTGATAAPLYPAAATAPAASDAAPASGASAAADAALEAIAAQEAAAPPAEARVERGPIPGSRRGADGVWELTQRPDKDEREMLYGQKWRVVESEASRKLFLGPDGEFGWDDFLDLINPLQHIPFVNIAYRAITGDQIHGAARMVDVAFGPLAGASTAIDLAFRDLTGGGMADNAVAALFGPGDASPGEEPVADVSVNTASFTPTQVADLTRRGSHR